MILLRLLVGILVLSIFVPSTRAQDEPIPSGWIVFETRRNGSLYMDLYRMRPNGSNQQRLTASPESEMHPVWSPDGAWIVFDSRGDQGKSLYLMRADGSEQRWLAALVDPPDCDDIGWDPIAAAWSPDGEWIVFDVYANGSRDLYRMRPNGLDLQRLTASHGSEMNPAWSPDGEWIVFVSDEDENVDLYRMRADGSEQQRLTHNPEKDSMAAWSPDSQWIVFVSTRNGIGQIYRMRADGAEQQPLYTNTHGSVRSPVWSPNGEWIAVSANRDISGGIALMRPDGSDLQYLNSPGRVMSDIAWSPDSEWLVFDTGQTGGYIDLYRVRVDGTELERLTDNPDIDLNPQWSP